MVSEESEYLGGRRMEHMLQALHRDGEAGRFFRAHVLRSGDLAWLHNLNLWTDVQQYHALFYASQLDPYIVRKKARVGFLYTLKTLIAFDFK